MNVHSTGHFIHLFRIESMKRYLLPILLLTLIGTTGCTGGTKDASVDDMFKEFSQVENAEYVNVNPFMMKIASLGTLFADADAAKIASKIKSVKVLTLDDSPADEKRRLNERISALNTDGYEELIRINDNGEKVRILAKMDKDSTIRRLIVLCTDSSDCTLVSINGKFSPKDINAVVNSATGSNHGGK